MINKSDSIDHKASKCQTIYKLTKELNISLPSSSSEDSINFNSKNEIADLGASKFYQKEKELNKKRGNLKEENFFFNKLYRITKKLYPKNLRKTFSDVIEKYKNNKYNIPKLSDNKNFFRPNPLLLVGKDLDEYYKNLGFESKDKLFIPIKKNKHINFLNKEQTYIDKFKLKYKILKSEQALMKSRNKNKRSNEEAILFPDKDYKSKICSKFNNVGKTALYKRNNKSNLFYILHNREIIDSNVKALKKGEQNEKNYQKKILSFKNNTQTNLCKNNSKSQKSLISTKFLNAEFKQKKISLFSPYINEKMLNIENNNNICDNTNNNIRHQKMKRSNTQKHSIIKKSKNDLINSISLKSYYTKELNKLARTFSDDFINDIYYKQKAKVEKSKNIDFDILKTIDVLMQKSKVGSRYFENYKILQTLDDIQTTVSSLGKNYIKQKSKFNFID